MPRTTPINVFEFPRSDDARRRRTARRLRMQQLDVMRMISNKPPKFQKARNEHIDVTSLERWQRPVVALNTIPKRDPPPPKPEIAPERRPKKKGVSQDITAIRTIRHNFNPKPPPKRSRPTPRPSIFPPEPQWPPPRVRTPDHLRQPPRTPSGVKKPTPRKRRISVNTGKPISSAQTERNRRLPSEVRRDVFSNDQLNPNPSLFPNPAQRSRAVMDQLPFTSPAPAQKVSSSPATFARPDRRTKRAKLTVKDKGKAPFRGNQDPHAANFINEDSDEARAVRAQVRKDLRMQEEHVGFIRKPSTPSKSNKRQEKPAPPPPDPQSPPSNSQSPDEMLKENHYFVREHCRIKGKSKKT